jgi:RNA polymerase sigma factor (TIGR02999 family)
MTSPIPLVLSGSSRPVIKYQAPEQSMHRDAGEITQLLHAWSEGDRSVEERLFGLLLPDLRNLARSLMRKERSNHTLGSGALLNEAYMRLLGGRKRDWEGRRHFFAVAARIMRRLLIDHARARPKTKIIPIEDLTNEPHGRATQIELAITMDSLLDELQASHPDWCSMLELKYFMGLKVEEIAEVLGLSLRTTQRQFGAALRWLFERLNNSSCATKVNATNA